MSKRIPVDVASFHLGAIENILELLRANGISTYAQLDAVRGRPLLDASLWILLETGGKYAGRYISQGVRNLELQLNESPNANSGKWNEITLVGLLGPCAAGELWQDHPDYCCNLEHVNERAAIIRALLNEPDRARAILDESLIGCVVLRSEHRQLQSAHLRPRDPWFRYRVAEPPVAVWDRQDKCWISLAPTSD